MQKVNYEDRSKPPFNLNPLGRSIMVDLIEGISHEEISKRYTLKMYVGGDSLIKHIEKDIEIYRPYLRQLKKSIC